MRCLVLHLTAAILVPTLDEEDDIGGGQKFEGLAEEPQRLGVMRGILEEGVDDFDLAFAFGDTKLSVDVILCGFDRTLTFGFDLFVGLVLHGLGNEKSMRRHFGFSFMD